MPDRVFSRDASERLTFEIFDLPADRYTGLVQEIVEAFKLEARSELVVGLDELFREYSCGEQIIGLEWDIWSGFIVVAKSRESESLVKAIADWLVRKLPKS